MVKTPAPEHGLQATHPNAQQDTVDWLGVALVLVTHLRLIVFLPMIAGAVAFAWTYTQKPMYSATTRFLPPQQQQSAATAMLQSLGTLGAAVGGAAGIKNQGEQYVSYLKSQRVQYDLLDRFNLMKRFQVVDKEDARAILSGRVRIVNGQDGIISVTVTDETAGNAAQLANAHVDAFRRLMQGMAVTEAQQRRVFFERQLLAAKGTLLTAEQDLKRSGVGAESIKLNPSAAVETVAKLRSAIGAQEIKLNALRAALTDQAPEVRAVQAELRALQKQLANQGGAAPDGENPANDYLTKYRNFKYQETLFEILSKQYEAARVDESREGAVIQVLDSAVPPSRPVSAKRIQMATLAAVSTFLACLAFLLIRQSLRRASSTESGRMRFQEIRRAWSRSLQIR